jgi:hypothetical protein
MPHNPACGLGYHALFALAYFSPNEKHAPSIFTSNFNHLTGIWRFQSDDYCSSEDQSAHGESQDFGGMIRGCFTRAVSTNSNLWSIKVLNERQCYGMCDTGECIAGSAHPSVQTIGPTGLSIALVQKSEYDNGLYFCAEERKCIM